MKSRSKVIGRSSPGARPSCRMWAPSLGWPGSDGKRSRTIHRAFLELGGRYRHCDVYWAMHERLKDRELVCHRAYWRRLGDDVIVAAKLADPRTADGTVLLMTVDRTPSSAWKARARV